MSQSGSGHRGDLASAFFTLMESADMEMLPSPSKWRKIFNFSQCYSPSLAQATNRTISRLRLQGQAQPQIRIGKHFIIVSLQYQHLKEEIMCL